MNFHEFQIMSCGKIPLKKNYATWKIPMWANYPTWQNPIKKITTWKNPIKTNYATWQNFIEVDYKRLELCNWNSHEKVKSSQSCKIHNLGISRLSLGNHRIKTHFNVIPTMKFRVYYNEEGDGLIPSLGMCM